MKLISNQIIKRILPGVIPEAMLKAIPQPVPEAMPGKALKNPTPLRRVHQIKPMQAKNLRLKSRPGLTAMPASRQALNKSMHGCIRARRVEMRFPPCFKMRDVRHAFWQHIRVLHGISGFNQRFPKKPMTYVTHTGSMSVCHTQSLIQSGDCLT